MKATHDWFFAGEIRPVALDSGTVYDSKENPIAEYDPAEFDANGNEEIIALVDGQIAGNLVSRGGI